MDQPVRCALFGCFTCRADPPRVAPSYAQIPYYPSVGHILLFIEVVFVIGFELVLHLHLKIIQMITASNTALIMHGVNTSTLPVRIATEDSGESKDVLLTLRFYSQNPFFVTDLPMDQRDL